MKKVLFLFLLLAGMTNVYGQKFAVKSNLLYDATATIDHSKHDNNRIGEGYLFFPRFFFELFCVLTCYP